MLPGVKRRGFMQLTGAAAVFALAGCYKQHPDTIVPYAQQPEGTALGKAVYYSSTLRDSGKPVAVMVKTYDGRPIKIEGNPDHPLARGRCDTRTQAALLNLYDPDRLQDGAQRRDGSTLVPIAWADLDKAVGAALASGAVGLLTGPVDGPARRQLIDELGSAFGARLQHAVLDAAADTSRLGDRGQDVVYRVDRAVLLLSLGGDFLGGGGTGLAEAVEFGDFRRLRGTGDSADLGQVVVFEGPLSQLGSVADVRVRVAPDRLALVAWGIAEIVAKALGQTLPDVAAKALDAARGAKPLSEALGLRDLEGVDPIAFAAGRLLAVKKAGKNSLVYDGPATTAHLGAAVNLLNSLLGNDGVTVDGAAVASTAISATAGAAAALIARAGAGEIATLIVVDVNPAFLFAGSPTAKALAAVKTLIVLADRITETAALAHYVAPTLHGLESWGDAEARAGVLSLQQPAIQPLWDARAAEESLLAFAVAAGAKTPTFVQPVVAADPRQVAVVSRRPLWQAAAAGVQSWQNYVRAVWLGAVKPLAKVAVDDRTFWNAALARGVVLVPVAAKALPEYKLPELPAFPAPRPDGALQLVVSPSRVFGDGTWLNNAWLQETSDPVAKITWDNWLALSPADAQRLGFAEHDVAKLSVGGLAVKLPVHVQEGQHPGVLQTFSGWGRAKDRAGAVANLGLEGLGYSVDVRPLAAAADQVPVLEHTGETWQLACTQGHQRMEGRDIARQDVLELHRSDPGARRRRGADELWDKGVDGKEGGRLSVFGTSHEYVGHKWGMAVDLTTCIGCQACVVACTAENNVPVVGRDEVRKGREMHWIRIDRYYTSTADAAGRPDLLDVEVVHQPVMCQQCGQAPCEEVCPAMATMHNDEGINHMVYNRCIGTRYCSNNCPYKVRRFNWYEYSKYRAGPVGSGSPLVRIARNIQTSGATSSQAELSQAPLQLLLNPEVTVRSRGVMEKCNFCLQRTREVREAEKASGSRFKDGAVTTACAQTCPTAGDHLRRPQRRGRRGEQGHRRRRTAGSCSTPSSTPAPR